jgi:hypothetical protein
MPKMTEKERLARHDKHDRQIASIRELILQGMRMVVESKKDIRELRAAQRRTDAAVKATADSLKAFIDTMRGVGTRQGQSRPVR